MFDRIIRWLFPTLHKALFSELNAIRQQLTVLEAGMRRAENRPLPRSRRVYVTVRGFYKLRGDEGDLTPHGWTQAVDIEEGGYCEVRFEPYNMFETERIDILGPAVIVGALVGMQAQESPKFEAPATFEFRSRIDVGNIITVRLKGTA